MDALEKMCRDHFNEPVLTFPEIGRCIGYGEDERDCYIIIVYAGGREIWHTCVGGYYFFDGFKGQEHVLSRSGEHWDDFTRLMGDMSYSIPLAKEFIVVRRDFGETK